MAQLKTKIWTAALVRRAFAGGAAAYVVRKGDTDAGVVFVKILMPQGARLFAPIRDMEGKRIWFEPVSDADEERIDAYLGRRLADDPDAWIVEVEDKMGRHFLTEPVKET